MTDYREFQDGELVPGTRYRVTRLVGTGGMGRVYEVEHQELGKRFVLKALLRELSRREDLVARLRNEWRALARLEHPNIVGVTDAGTSDNGVPYYVMERLEGQTLALLMHRTRRLHPQQALGIASGSLEGLHAAHQIGVVHRDVKPPNIFLTASGAVKVLDFGIAKIKDAQGVITARGIAVGTPRYMSPEQAQGAAVDARSDIYATGLMLFEMLSGVGPFDDAVDHNELLLAHLGRPAPLLSSMCVVAPELDALVAAMLAKDPRERPGSALQVAEAFRALSQRYENFVATDAPTLNVTPRPRSSVDVPTRQEGMRRPSRSASAPTTRPDAPLALGRAPESEATTLRPALGFTTTAAPLPAATPAGGTVRLEPSLVASPLSFYGPDTLVESLTNAPTGVPASAAERTEHLLTLPLPPGARAPTDPGPTRTAVPHVEPNLTPPPVVPASASGVGEERAGARLWPLFVAAGVGVLGGSAWLWRPAQDPLDAVGKNHAAAPPPVVTAAPAAPPAEPSSLSAPPPAALSALPQASTAGAAAAAAPSVSVAAAPVTPRNGSQKRLFLSSRPSASEGPRPAPPEPRRPAQGAGMPGSGL